MAVPREIHNCRNYPISSNVSQYGARLFAVKPFTSVCILLILLITIPGLLHARTNILFTIDVESRTSPSQDIWGRINNDKLDGYGITRIMDILDKWNVRGTFFLNVYEAQKFGEAALSEVANAIVNRRHDLQLHTHPFPMFKAWEMAQADLKTQEEILSTGMSLIHKWTGRNVVAHRAGGISANMDTVNALKRVGLISDSSFLLTSNAPGVFDNGILEIPITVYDRFRIFGWHYSILLDIESSTANEIQSVISQMTAHSMCTVVVIMHSFSFVRYGKPDYYIMQRLDDVLQFISSNHDMKVSTYSESSQELLSGSSCDVVNKFVPETGFFLSYMGAIENYSYGWKNKLFVIAVPIAIGLILSMLVFVFRLSYQKRNTMTLC